MRIWSPIAFEVHICQIRQSLRLGMGVAKNRSELVSRDQLFDLNVLVQRVLAPMQHVVCSGVYTHHEARKKEATQGSLVQAKDTSPVGPLQDMLLHFITPHESKYFVSCCFSKIIWQDCAYIIIQGVTSLRKVGDFGRPICGRISTCRISKPSILAAFWSTSRHLLQEAHRKGKEYQPDGCGKD